MTLLQNTAEGGTAGTAATTANTGGGSGDAFAAITLGASYSIVFSTEQAAHGTKSYKVATATPSAAETAFVQYGSGPAEAAAARAYVRYTALPASAQLMSVRGTSGVMARWQCDASGKLQLVDNAGASLLLSAAALPLNTWIRLEIWTQRGTTTTNGKITGAWYLGDATTPEETFTSVAVNAGLNQANFLQVGRIASAGSVPTFYLDDVAFSDGATGLLGPVAAANVAPTVSAGADQTNVEPWATVTLTGTDSDSDGTIASRSWTQTGGSPTVTLSGTGATRTFEAPGTIAGTTLTLQYAATDDDGASTTDSMTVAVLPAAERIMIGGSWVPCRMRLL